MLYFKIPTGIDIYEKWTDQLKDWCVSYKLEFSETINKPSLREDSKAETIGEENIDLFLKEYKQFMDEWYDCRCDKWMEE